MFLHQVSRRFAQLIEGADGAPQQYLGFREIGSDNGGLREKPGRERRDGVALEQLGATTGHHHGIDNHPAELAAGKTARNGRDDRRVVEHAGFCGADGERFKNAIHLLGNEARREGLDGADPSRILRGDARNRACAEDAINVESLEVRLNAGTATAV